jgi:hypothetical protein
LLPFGFFFAFLLPKIEESGSKKSEIREKGDRKASSAKNEEKSGRKVRTKRAEKKECEMW